MCARQMSDRKRQRETRQGLAWFAPSVVLLTGGCSVTTYTSDVFLTGDYTVPAMCYLPVTIPLVWLLTRGFPSDVLITGDYTSVMVTYRWLYQRCVTHPWLCVPALCYLSVTLPALCYSPMTMCTSVVQLTHDYVYQHCATYRWLYQRWVTYRWLYQCDGYSPMTMCTSIVLLTDDYVYQRCATHRWLCVPGFWLYQRCVSYGWLMTIPKHYVRIYLRAVVHELLSSWNRNSDASLRFNFCSCNFVWNEKRPEQLIFVIFQVLKIQPLSFCERQLKRLEFHEFFVNIT